MQIFHCILSDKRTGSGEQGSLSSIKERKFKLMEMLTFGKSYVHQRNYFLKPKLYLYTRRIFINHFYQCHLTLQKVQLKHP